MNRTELADIILHKIESVQDKIRSDYAQSRSRIGHFFIDDLLPEDLALEIYRAFPDPNTMRMRKSLREFKYIAAQMDQYNPILEEIVYAFQDSRIVHLVGELCEIESIHPDETLYAGGISLMGPKQFLNPHLDNSHDNFRERWRVLNLLYYVTPEWKQEFGGNLELWPQGVNKPQITVHSKFNRLVVMATHNHSWHSVSPVSHPTDARCCVSNYYFSEVPLRENSKFHVTSFRGRPGQKLRDLVLQADSALRMSIRKVFSKGVVKNDHVYKKENQSN